MGVIGRIEREPRLPGGLRDVAVGRAGRRGHRGHRGRNGLGRDQPGATGRVDARQAKAMRRRAAASRSPARVRWGSRPSGNTFGLCPVSDWTRNYSNFMTRERRRDRPDRTVPLLADDDLGHALVVAIRIVAVFTMNEQDHIGILSIDATAGRSLMIGRLSWRFCDLTRQLGQRDHRALEFLWPATSASARSHRLDVSSILRPASQHSSAEGSRR